MVDRVQRTSSCTVIALTALPKLFRTDQGYFNCLLLHINVHEDKASFDSLFTFLFGIIVRFSNKISFSQF
jgi:hypothetical protein